MEGQDSSLTNCTLHSMYVSSIVSFMFVQDVHISLIEINYDCMGAVYV